MPKFRTARLLAETLSRIRSTLNPVCYVFALTQRRLHICFFYSYRIRNRPRAMQGLPPCSNGFVAKAALHYLGGHSNHALAVRLDLLGACRSHCSTRP